MALAHDIQNLSLINPGDKLGHALTAAVAALVARGWVVRGSGDGVAAFQNLEQTAGPYNVFTSGVGYRNTSGVWNSPTVANTISNPRAWIRLKEPVPSTREIIFQRSSSTSSTGNMNLVGRMAVGGYTGSGATANTPPSAPGGDFGFIGTTTTAFNGTGIIMFSGSSPTELNTSEVKFFNMLISDSARATNVWPFVMFCYDANDRAYDFGIVYESLVDPDASDTQPFLIFGEVWTTVFGTPRTTSHQAWIGRNPSGGAFQTIGTGNYVWSGITVPGGVPEVDSDGKLRTLQIPWMTSVTAPTGVWKGHCEHLVFNPTSRDYPLVQDFAGTARIYLGRFLAPWTASLVPGN